MFPSVYNAIDNLFGWWCSDSGWDTDRWIAHLLALLRSRCWSIICSILNPFSPFPFLQGNQEPTATPDAMVQPFTTIPFPPPPQNGIPTEYGVPHTQDYAGQTSEHNLTLYGSTQAHGEQSTNTASTQNGSLTVCTASCRVRK